MGTHPIFESDFDCLTAKKMLTPVARQSLTQVRNSSGKLKELGIRLKSIRNIEKITKTMKMISSAKFAKASKTIGPARAFGEGAQAVDAKENTEGSTKELYINHLRSRSLRCTPHHHLSRGRGRDERLRRRRSRVGDLWRQGPRLLRLEGPTEHVARVQRGWSQRPHFRGCVIHGPGDPGLWLRVRVGHHQVQSLRLGHEAGPNQRHDALRVLAVKRRPLNL